MVCDNTTLRSSGARGLDVSRCYRHIAPLERKAPMHQNSRCVMHRRGEVASPSGLGQPTPTGSMVCDNTTLRSSGARGLDVSRCYRHIAPLERKAPTHQNSRCVMHRRGEVASPAGWGTQRLRVQWCATIPYCAPLERGGWTCRAAIDISLLWSERHRCTKIQGA